MPKMQRIHLGGSIQGCLDILHSISNETRSSDFSEIVAELEALKATGATHWTSCPSLIEVRPGVFECPGHPIEDDDELPKFETLTEGVNSMNK